jgi:signal transduction histidine kinase
MSPCAPAHGCWDRARIEQAITTFLLFNVGRKTQNGALRIRIDSDELSARLTLQERGLGTTFQRLGQFFDSLERGTDGGERGGIELGLYLAREIVVAHGGAIRVAITPDHGSSFTLELPRALGSRTASAGLV